MDFSGNVGEWQRNVSEGKAGKYRRMKVIEMLWCLPVHGQIIHYGENRPLHEIVAYCYPSHRAFFNIRDAPARKDVIK